MIDRFEKLTTGVTQIYKSVQKIKRCHMDSLGLKGTHVMCLHYLWEYPDGLTAADLCGKCREDKGGISRILSDLEKTGLITYLSDSLSKDSKRYRAKAVLTEPGKRCAKKVTDLIMHATIAGGLGLTEEERDIFYRVLFKIADNLDQVCQNLEKKSPGRTAEKSPNL